MHLGDLLFEISKRGITLTCEHTEDRLNAKPTAALTPELIEEIKQHKKELIEVVREDEEMHRTGIIQSERQVFDLRVSSSAPTTEKARRERVASPRGWYGAGPSGARGAPVVALEPGSDL